MYKIKIVLAHTYRGNLRKQSYEIIKFGPVIFKFIPNNEKHALFI